MSKPLSPDEMKAFSLFIRGFFQGTIELGFGAMPMIQLYNRAREHQTSLMDILVADPETAAALAQSLAKQAARLPPKVLMGLSHVITEARQAQELGAKVKQSQRDNNEDV